MSRRISFIATTLMVGTFVFVLFWTWRMCSWLLPLLVADDARWHTFYAVENRAEIDLVLRVSYGLIWLGALVVGWCLAYYTIRLMWTYRNGEYFTLKSARLITCTGLGLAMVGVYDTFLASVLPVILSMNNPTKTETLRYWFDPSDITMLISGLGFVLIGLVTKQAFNIARENESFL